MAYIDVIAYEDSEGQLREIYDELIKKRGKLAEVHKIQSLNPPTIMAHMDLYMAIMFGKSPLRREQREMIAVVVSASNQCPYCIRHHAEALRHFWKDEKKVKILADDFRDVDLPLADQLLCELAKKLTLEPNFSNREEFYTKLSKAGIDDRALLDSTLVIAYFNFVNRIVTGLGVDLEEDPAGYEYE